MKRRYRSLRKEFFMQISVKKKIHWVGHRYPQPKDPPCEDPQIIEFIESRPGFGKKIWIEEDPKEIFINPQAVPPDTELVHLQNAARKLVTMGLHVNPKLLKQEEDEEPPQLPSKTFVSSAKRSELEEVIDRFGWEIDKNLNVKELKSAIREQIDASQ